MVLFFKGLRSCLAWLGVALRIRCPARVVFILFLSFVLLLSPVLPPLLLSSQKGLGNGFLFRLGGLSSLVFVLVSWFLFLFLSYCKYKKLVRVVQGFRPLFFNFFLLNLRRGPSGPAPSRAKVDEQRNGRFRDPVAVFLSRSVKADKSSA